METILTWLADLEPSHWIAIGAAIIATASLLVSWYSSVYQRRLDNDSEMLDQVVLTLERAYSAIAAPTPSEAPLQDRLGWLTAARHLIAFQGLKERLKTPLYKMLCEEHEEYWRHRFYVLLSHIANSAFFQWMDSDTRQREMIDPKSAAIVLGFSDWPEGREDPLDAVLWEDLLQKHDFRSVRFRHFRDYLDAHFPGALPPRENDS